MQSETTRISLLFTPQFNRQCAGGFAGVALPEGWPGVIGIGMREKVEARPLLRVEIFQTQYSTGVCSAQSATAGAATMSRTAGQNLIGRGLPVFAHSDYQR